MECDADDKLSIREFWRQFNIKMVIAIRFRFNAFSIYAAVGRCSSYFIGWTVFGKCIHFYSNFSWQWVFLLFGRSLPGWNPSP
jgi:hypothetical protein